ncbi:peptidase MA family metallohydrolase [Gemmatimonadota bacterium]
MITDKRVELYYQPRDSKVAVEYLEWAASYRPRPAFLERVALNRLKIYVAPTEAEFYRLTGGNLPEWGVACAFPGLDLVVVRSPRLVPLWKEKPRSILLHEISHVFLDQQLRPAEIPRWFHEGFALYCSQAWDVGSFLKLSLALVLGNFFPLDSLTSGFPSGESASRLAYLQSYTVVEYLFSSRDSRQLASLFRKWRETGDLDKALRSGFGMTLLRFEKRWREWALVRYGWMKLLTSVTLVWLVAAILFIFVYINRRIKFHRGLDRMKLQEARDRHGQEGHWQTTYTEPEGYQAGESTESWKKSGHDRTAPPEEQSDKP